MKLLSFVVLLIAANAAFAQGAGRFLSVVGDVRITGTDGKTRAAERGAELSEGETIVTAANALAQLRMADGAQMSVRPETEMKLDRFSYAGAEDRQPTFLASIVKGGLRVITGLMARQNRAGYQIRTASATMGVRGTHFELVHVTLPQPELLPGTYNRVYDGITTIENKSGVALLVNRDQTAFISLPGNLAPQIVVPPPAIFGRPTPVPGVVMRPQPRDTHKGEVARPAVRDATTVMPPRTIQTTPIETRTLQTTPILTSPILTSPTTTTISPTLDTSTTTIKLDTSTTLIAPTTTTTTTTTNILTSPTTTTISPTLTSPTTTTTTTTNILTSPTTTTISPTLTSPTIK
jgi:hypothetical protein